MKNITLIIQQKKYIIFALLLITTGCGTQKEKNVCEQSHQTQKQVVTIINIEELVDALYGKNGANLDLEKIFAIQDLIKIIVDLSDQEQQHVALATIRMLEESMTDETLQLKNVIHTYLIKYLKKFAHTYGDKNINDSQSFNDNTLEVARKVLNYINIEQENIFINQKSKHIFLRVIERRSNLSKNTQLPWLINFWATSPGQQILINYDASDQAKIQFLGMNAYDLTWMAVDMGVMLAVSQGVSLANQSITTEGQLLSAKINKNSLIIQANMKAFQTSSQLNQQKKLQSMVYAFSVAQKDIQEKTKQASIISNLELNYLYKNISMDQPQQNYIFNQIEFDQLFSLGTMLTPAGTLWKNPFSVGDWEYEAASNSFWQYQSSPMFNKTTDEDTGETVLSSLQAENNAIYAEYFTAAPSYTIAGTISLQSASFPFFTGIIFNKSRWISGDFEAIRKCRMIGIYGASDTNVGIYFAQQYTMTEDQLKTSPNDSPIQTPLQQIINNKVNKKIDLPASSFTNLQSGPITFNYEINNSPTKVDFKLWTENNPPITITMSDLDPTLYMYHGIGFVCPGAVAEFTLTQPQDFIFTPEAISNYKE